ncbi:MAG: beta-propeller fold lactonase family protein [Methylocella sp.]
MRSKNSNGSRAASARGFMPVFGMLAMGLGLLATAAAAAPFAYVTNESDNTVSVIDTATNKVVATVPVAGGVGSIAVAPDGKHAYVANFDSNTVSVIDTASNTVVATVPIGCSPASNTSCLLNGVAVTPDGKYAYVANSTSIRLPVIPDGKHPDVMNNGKFSFPGPGTVSVIDTATNTVVGSPIPVGVDPRGVAITPDGTRAYVANSTDPGGGPGTVSVIATASNTVVATVQVGGAPGALAITPDGKHAYVTNGLNTVSVIATATNKVVATVPLPVNSGPIGVAITPDGKNVYVANGFSSPSNVSVIATASNTVVATVPVGNIPDGVAITPDGKHAYVANRDSNSVSVIDTATNMVVATVTVGSGPEGVGNVPPPPGVPFLAFNAKLAIQFGSIPNKDAFGFGSNFTLSSTAPAINPVTAPVTLQVGTFSTTIPPGSFIKQTDGSFTFQGKIQGVGLGALIKQRGTLRYAFEAQARGANLTGTVNTVYATLIIGGDSGATSVTAEISH